MSSHSNTPSREHNDDGAFVRLPSDSSQDGSAGGRSSLKPGADAGGRTESAAKRTDLKFPEGNRYQQLSEPIPGGMGAVFKALDTRLDIDVAIKRIRPELAKDTELIKRFEREAKMQVRLKHQHLVSVKDYVSDSYGPYIVMDWIDGQSLASVIRNSGAMAWRDAAILISKVAMALQEAHENNIIHRDVKPGNILLDKKGEPYITDFGLACAESASVIGYVSEKNAAVGTAYFMSPEQKNDPKSVTFHTDMWSLGATLYQLLTTDDVAAWDPELIPEELRGAVTKALKRSPSDRFGTMKLFAQELTLCVSNNGPKPGAAKAAAPPEEEDIADIWRKAQERTDKAHADAKSTAERKQDYAAAVQIMEQIPEHLRKKKLYEELIRRRDRVIALDAKIRDGVAQLRTEGLKDVINELLKLQPSRQDIKTLLQEIQQETTKDRFISVPIPSSADAGNDSAYPGAEIHPADSPPSRKVAAQPATSEVLPRRRWLLGAGGSLAVLGGITIRQMWSGNPEPSSSSQSEVIPSSSGKGQSSNKIAAYSPPKLSAPFTTAAALGSQLEWAKHLGISVEVKNRLGMKFRVIPPGTFEMGSPASEPNRSDSESLHKVTITLPKLLGVYPVTQGEWTNVMGSNPSKFKSVNGEDTSRFPVEQVSWDLCQDFLQRLNAAHGMKGWCYRLPTEAEWEYACRAGTTTPFWFGAELNGKQANCNGNFPYQTQSGVDLQRPTTVGSYGANPCGLYDQHGNVIEWCEDWYGDYDTSVTEDPTGPSSGYSRVLRGGSWCYTANACRSAYRLSNEPSYRDNHIGFRVLCELS